FELISSRLSIIFGSSSYPRLPLSVDTMVKQSSGPSAASAARSAVVLSKAVEKSFALEVEVSWLRHHVGVLSRRLHVAGKELDGLKLVNSAMSVLLSSSLDKPAPPTVAEVVVPEGVAPSVALGGGSVAPSVVSGGGPVAPSVALGG